MVTGKIKSWSWRDSQWFSAGPSDYSRVFSVQVGPYYVGFPWGFGTKKPPLKKEGVQ